MAGTKIKNIKSNETKCKQNLEKSAKPAPETLFFVDTEGGDIPSTKETVKSQQDGAIKSKTKPQEQVSSRGGVYDLWADEGILFVALH